MGVAYGLHIVRCGVIRLGDGVADLSEVCDHRLERLRLVVAEGTHGVRLDVEEPVVPRCATSPTSLQHRRIEGWIGTDECCGSMVLEVFDQLPLEVAIPAEVLIAPALVVLADLKSHLVGSHHVVRDERRTHRLIVDRVGDLPHLVASRIETTSLGVEVNVCHISILVYLTVNVKPTRWQVSPSGPIRTECNAS